MCERVSFLKEHYKLIKALEPSEQGVIYQILMQYQFEGIVEFGDEEISALSKIGKAVLENVIESINRINKKSMNGKKGGAPKGNQNAKKKVHDSDCLNDISTSGTDIVITKNNEEVKEEVKKDNIGNIYATYNSFSISPKSMEERQPFISYFKEYIFPFGTKITIPESHLKVMYEFIDGIIEALACSRNGLKYNGHIYNEHDILTCILHLTTDTVVSIMRNLLFSDSIENRPRYILGCILQYKNTVRFNENFYQLCSDLGVVYEQMR